MDSGLVAGAAGPSRTGRGRGPGRGEPAEQAATCGTDHSLPWSSMAEDWLDCPVLGPGWKRRESFRKSGASCGRSDTYYQSPTGERIRSKIELTRFLGPDCDLSRFDFRHGVLQYNMPAKASQKKKRQPWHRKAVPSVKQKQSQQLRFSPPPPQDPQPRWCENCGASLLGDNTGRQRLRSLCQNCRARRNAFNREQRMFKRVGCGDCAACRVTEDCGVCSACIRQLPQLPRSQCAQRICLKITNKSFRCGLCSACQTKEDCGICRICKRRERPGLKRRWKCVQRRCLKKRIIKKPLGLATRKLPGTWRRGPVPPPTAQATGPSRTSKEATPSKARGWQRRVTATATARDMGRKAKEPKWGQDCPAPSKLHYSSCRQSRRCGACAACQRCVDCGQCDFCQDKPKFGGCNQKRQKCRWRQCLFFAMEYECPGLGVFSSPTVKQEAESYETEAPGAAFPPSAGFSPALQSKGADRAQLQHLVKQEENVVKEEEEEEEITKEDIPVIMEIYSLSGITPIAAGPCGVLDSVLQEFLEELNELPLPAHWAVLPPMGPDLCIVQHSPLSTMSAAVIHIQPGLFFYVVVRGIPVPSSHELYLAHPLRLTTVDEVVELICNLEAYHVCPGWSGSWQGLRSPDCDVLVYEDRCQACSLEHCTAGVSSS
ncbi:methyl-CpG-binding domain protein 1-like isoform X6 [Notamacropus eugenii]|uniref:methyl-CpG-binding domain protein 1-like isoform X6 n=1 Tax=Notamacropus eugenii TaxID=9315 RepID=UPI003B680E23